MHAECSNLMTTYKQEEIAMYTAAKFRSYYLFLIPEQNHENLRQGFKVAHGTA
jgi:hypothetical protein